MQPNPEEIRRIILAALTEDIGHGDITSAAVIPEDADMVVQFVAREPVVACGVGMVGAVFYALNPLMEYQLRCEEGQKLEAGSVMASVMGNARAILAAERVALNLLQRMCSVATLTAAYVNAVAGTKAKILDTRKTMPGLREIDKYAVRVGGGQNHRMRLDDAVLIKDNHIAIVGSVAEAIARARAAIPATMRIEIECDTLEQVKEAVAARADMLLLDNMSPATLKEAVDVVAGRAACEASGNVTLENVAAIASTGVDFISVGRLTHSVRQVDIGLDAIGNE